MVNKTPLKLIPLEFTQEILYYFYRLTYYKLMEEYGLNTDEFKNILSLKINLE